MWQHCSAIPSCETLGDRRKRAGQIFCLKKITAANLVSKGQNMVPSLPQQMLDEPGRGETAASLAHLQEKDNLSMDDLMKVTMKDRQIQKLPGLPQWEASGSSEEDGEAWSSSSKGGKGIEQVEKLKTTPREVPGENGTKNAACSGGIRVQQQCAVPVCEVHAGRKEPDRRLLHLGSWQRFTSC